MNLLSAEGISKSYSERKLFNNINLGINEGDKIGVIGINGTGKSTLLKVIAGVEESDSGRIIKGNSVRIEYLAQNPYFDPEASVLEQVFKGNSPIMKVIREYEEAVENPETSSGKLMKLMHNMDALNAWSLENEAKSVLTQLGITEFKAKVGTLSGGQRKRIALASALINPSDLLILDEPTNHLDNDTIDWLEQYLNKRKGALLMITHDRYFLDRVVNEIIELDKGNLYTYKGNYSTFLEKKLERESIEATNEKKRQSLLKKELAWIKRGAKARTTKQKARIERFEKLSQQEVNISNEKIDISVGSSRLGKKVIELRHINKAFGDKKLIDDFSYIVLRNDRVGIIGPNGMGKSTLINILSGRIEPDNGEIEIGETVKIGLYSQEASNMNESLRVIEYIKEAAEFLTTADGDKITASQMLERFLFPPSAQWTPISKLSGGEKRRLYLLRVLMEAPNVLLLDEPTNDLDTETLTILEDYLENFQGAVITVSHDRYFLDRMAEKIFAFEGNGKIVQYTGNYSEFKESVTSSNVQKEDKDNNKNSKNVNKNNSERKKERALKFSYKEQKEYEEIDSVIASLEEKIEELENKINEASSDYGMLQDLLKEKEEVEKELEEKMERWVYLNELAEKIENSK
ncbi:MULTISPECIES: ABC-F family ATP-binding cassette domain-containing protein [Clostridium]|uniref:Putative ABC transporter ATP-binding protein YjjK n=2 Tax=Clostridium TaxID=1485 RepID=A0A151AKX4_9CLOT|nr:MULTISPECIES: ABC-F family ATP-binding cassette domain-containing protein [Clostridium]KYH28273.1 putative ABC transporter ATP-binding protein YjjK [Clostridium colicanis DSM 13634]MBE6043666.1 ABC-F family ATP-binding cassette domain-containing protein [Clostridium thermopalmarium]PRR74279.1 putative ABC transporter ATP-binding protein YjjK [Clostridium thermopalmarium DSM 5974]PVZ22067.1 ATP-binding cassette subfamily F protein uup [Clostridium thermopalmarium DSM 5974]